MVMVDFQMESRGQVSMEPRELAAGLEMESKAKSGIKGDAQIFGRGSWVNDDDTSEKYKGLYNSACNIVGVIMYALSQSRERWL